VFENIDACKSQLGDIKPVLPVASGGLYPRLVPALLETFGNDVVLQAGGGIHGHPDGTVAGAKAMRQALDATLKGLTLEEYAKTHKELKVSLEHWKI
jgi:ribulose-bisphosphate carboxylase large chain